MEHQMSDTSFEEHAQVELGDNILAQIAQTARDILQAEKDVAEREQALKDANAILRTLKDEVMVELMTAAGQDLVKTVDGITVKIEKLTRGSPSEENMPAALKWLQEHGHGGIIKSEVKADLGKADPEKVKAVMLAMTMAGAKPAAKKSVAWQTLGALANELMEKGVEVPLDILGVFHIKQAKITLPK